MMRRIKECEASCEHAQKRRKVSDENGAIPPQAPQATTPEEVKVQDVNAPSTKSDVTSDGKIRQLRPEYDIRTIFSNPTLAHRNSLLFPPKRF